MSDNVEFVRSIYEQWERGEFDSLGWAHAEIEFVVVDGPQPTYTRGLRAMLHYWHEFLRAWDGHGVAVDEYRELNELRVLVILRLERERANANELELGGHGPAAVQVLDVRDGTVTRVVTYFTRERALAELGLEK